MSRELYEKIRANQRCLDACPRHRFNLHDPPYRFGQKITCEVCGGEMCMIQAGQYARGYAAAGRDIEDVMPGWNKPLAG